MARGKTKQTKGQRMRPARYQPNTYSGPKPSPTMLKALAEQCYNEGYDPFDLPPHHPDGELCRHDADGARLQEVSKLFTKMFADGFKQQIGPYYSTRLLDIQFDIVRAVIASYVEDGWSPKSMHAFATSKYTEEKFRFLIRTLCDEEFCSLAWRSSTETTFDLVCVLASRHGRALDIQGPPCACSLAHCAGCLDSLAEQLRETPTPPSKCDKHRDQSEIMAMLKRTLQSEPHIDPNTPAEMRMQQLTDVWKMLDDTYWKAAESTDPMEFPQVKDLYDKIRGADGILLWYTVAARELESSYAVGNGKKISQINYDYDVDIFGQDLFAESTGSSSKKHDSQDLARRARKALARVCREHGNASFNASKYKDAAMRYARAALYDGEEAIYPLNRAQCLIRLQRYAEAEDECTAAIKLDNLNYKARYRRGLCRAHRGRFREAWTDLQTALILLGDNEQSYRSICNLGQKTLSDLMSQKGVSQRTLPPLTTYEAFLERQKRQRAKDLSGSQMKESNDVVGAPARTSGVAKKVEEHQSSVSSTQSPGGNDQTLQEAQSQFIFALAFCKIVEDKTGVKVPLPFLQSPSSSSKARL